MTNVTAALTEGQSVAKGYSDKNQAFTFRIPVYDNMPSSAVGFNKAGDTNNYLQSLSISGVTLTPSLMELQQVIQQLFLTQLVLLLFPLILYQLIVE